MTLGEFFSGLSKYCINALKRYGADIFEAIIISFTFSIFFVLLNYSSKHFNLYEIYHTVLTNTVLSALLSMILLLFKYEIEIDEITNKLAIIYISLNTELQYIVILTVLFFKLKN